MSPRALPVRPDLEQYKKQAKELLRACANAAPEALQRVRLHHPRFRDLPAANAVKLADAQLVIAREHAFDTWAKFSQHIQSAKNGSARVTVDGIEIELDVTTCEGATGLVLFGHASAGSRHAPGNRYIADELWRARIATIQADLFTDDEELADIRTDELRFDLHLMGRRIGAITNWIGAQARFKNLPLGYMGSGTGAAAMVFAAAHSPTPVLALVSAAGRPDLAGPWIGRVDAPLLFVVGSKDTVGLGFTSPFLAPLPNVANRSMAIVEGANQLLTEEDSLQKTTRLARDWFRRYLVAA